MDEEEKKQLAPVPPIAVIWLKVWSLVIVPPEIRKPQKPYPGHQMSSDIFGRNLRIDSPGMKHLHRLMLIFSHLTQDVIILPLRIRKPQAIYGSPEVYQGCHRELTIWVVTHWQSLDEIHNTKNDSFQLWYLVTLENVKGSKFDTNSFSKSSIVNLHARSKPSAGVIWNGSGDTKPIASV